MSSFGEVYGPNNNNNLYRFPLSCVPHIYEKYTDFSPSIRLNVMKIALFKEDYGEVGLGNLISDKAKM